MSTAAAELQSWADTNGVRGVRFYPENPHESSPGSLMDGALTAIKAFEEGLSTPYVDPIKDGEA